MDAARALLSALPTLDGTQERKKSSSKAATANAKAAVMRLNANLQHLGSIARAALPVDRAAQFEGELPRRARSSSKGRASKAGAATPA